VSPIPPISPLPALPAMPPMPVSPLGAGPSAPGALRTTGAGVGAMPVGPADFAAALADAVSGLNTRMTGAERLSEAVATGKIADPTAALVEIERADLAFQTAMQVRNKLVEGWQEISRMTV
jgi:flagellar hook-basal body complex protein FliE